MAYDIARYSARFQQIESSLSRGHEAYMLAAGLVAGLAFGAPLFGWALTPLGVPQPLPLLAGVAVVGGLYGLSVLLLGRIVLGLGVSFVVTSTFAANVPLTATAGTYPGSLGPQLWLVQLPIICLLALYGLGRSYSLRPFTKAEYAFGAFVLWSGLSAVLGSPERPETALYFTVFMLTVWLAFVVANRSVRHGVFSLRQVIGVFLIAVCGHVMFALAQFVNQEPFGLSPIGETGREGLANTIDLGVLGEYVIGVIISGLAGGTGQLSVLLVVAIPLALGFAFGTDTTRRRRAVSIFAAISMIAVLRLTGKDAARAAVFVALGTFVLLALWSARSAFGSVSQWLRDSSHSARAVLSALSMLLSVAILGYPSSQSGQASREVQLESQESSTSGGGDGGGGGGGNGNGLSNNGSVDVSQITVPFFDLSSLGIRIQQHIAGVLIALANPLFGVGGANYPYVAPAYGLPGKHPSGIPFPLHNAYFAVLAETGFPGFILYVTALVLVFLAGWRLLIGSARERVFVSGVVSSMVGYAAVSFWYPNHKLIFVLPFWLLVGAVVAAGSTRRVERR